MLDKLKEFGQRALRRPAISHLVRAQARYSSRLGNHFAAAITYFTVLAAVPVVAFSFSVLSVVLTRVRPDVIEAIKNLVVSSLGATGGSGKLTEIIDSSVRTTGSWWTLMTTVAVTLWAGVSWVGHIRAGIRAQSEPAFSMVPEDENYLMGKVRDSLSFITALVVLLVTFATAQGGATMSGQLGRRLGIDLLPGHKVYLTLAGLVVSTGAGTFFFVFLYGLVPRSRRNWPAILRGSLAAGICLAVVQTGAGVLVRAVRVNRAVQAFGSIIVVMLVLNILARMILLVAAWIGTTNQPAVPYRWNDADAALEHDEDAWIVEEHWAAAHADKKAKEAEQEGHPDAKEEAPDDRSGESGTSPGDGRVARPDSGRQAAGSKGAGSKGAGSKGVEASRAGSGRDALRPSRETITSAPGTSGAFRRAGLRGFLLGAVFGALVAALSARGHRD